MPLSGHALVEPADRAVALEAELNDFSYMVSHDLAASFRHVAEFSRLLTSEISGFSPRQRTHAEFIQSAAIRCQAMLDGMLTFSQAQQKPIAPTHHDATATMRLAMGQLANLEASVAKVTLEPLGDVFADAKLLAVAFGSLLENAIKFVAPGVKPRVAIEPAHDAETWRVQITDNGVGIDPKLAERAFQMFRRLNGEDAFPGAGTGLAICRRIARRHGGDVRFLSRAQGACVELSLPRKPSIETTKVHADVTS